MRQFRMALMFAIGALFGWAGLGALASLTPGALGVGTPMTTSETIFVTVTMCLLLAAAVALARRE